MKRRTYLLLAGTASLSGCQVLGGCDASERARLECSAVELNDGMADNVVQTVYGRLDAEEQAVVDEGLSGDGYQRCPPYSDAFDTLSETMIENYSEGTDIESDRGYQSWPYIEKDGQNYRCLLAVGDQIYADV